MHVAEKAGASLLRHFIVICTHCMSRGNAALGELGQAQKRCNLIIGTSGCTAKPVRGLPDESVILAGNLGQSRSIYTSSSVSAS